ncbi:ABC transporter ATP-binding protein [Corynebacterium felinum]|nr:ABC transporter ATP-binding protein [Corynebacterium felinum]MDF5821439.1 ABC transporter ATP-binding protein [Corynebacterium felinum]
MLDDFSMAIQPHEIIGVVGASGAGKTTVARLALHFLDPRAGRVCFHGADIRQFDPDTYRDNIALVPQESYVFAGSVAENLRIAAPLATDQQCWEALEAAELAGKIREIGGLEAQLGDASDSTTALSGGEKQRLGIARAFIRQCPLVLLDEPLANLDPSLEHSIAGQLRRLCADRTVMIIAHRLHTIAIADRIVLLKDGSVLASGSYEQMRTHPEFIRLFARQLDAE